MQVGAGRLGECVKDHNMDELGLHSELGGIQGYVEKPHHRGKHLTLAESGRN